MCLNSFTLIPPGKFSLVSPNEQKGEGGNKMGEQFISLGSRDACVKRYHSGAGHFDSECVIEIAGGKKKLEVINT